MRAGVEGWIKCVGKVVARSEEISLHGVSCGYDSVSLGECKWRTMGVRKL